MSSPKKTQSVPIDAMATAFAGLAKGGGGVKIKAGDGIPGAVPAGVANSGSGMEEGTFPPHVQFTLKAWSPAFEMGEEFLTFGIAELDPAQEAKAVELGGKSAGSVTRELVKMALVRIGPKARPDYAFIERWLKEIGPKARRQVDLAYMNVNLTGDDEGEAFLATKVPQYG